jgi:hypothetical protein
MHNKSVVLNVYVTLNKQPYMKRTLLFFVLVFISISGFGQRFEIGVNGGIALNAPPMRNFKDQYFFNPKRYPSDVTLTGGMNIGYNINSKWQMGVSVGVMKLSYKDKGYVSNSPYTPEFPPYYKMEFVVANPAIPINVYIDRKWRLRKLQTYAGITGGYVLLQHSERLPSDFILFPNHRTENLNGYDLGLQAGSAYSISKHFALTAQLSCLNIFLEKTQLGNDLFAFTATVGAKYCF